MPLPKKIKDKKPVGRPVDFDYDGDEDFKPGPIEEPVKAKPRAKQSGKSRKPSQSNIEKTPAVERLAKKQKPAPSRKPRRKVTRRRQPEPACNPLIELLGVEEDSYFKAWMSDEEEEEESEEESEEETVTDDDSQDSGLEVRRKHLASRNQPPLQARDGAAHLPRSQENASMEIDVKPIISQEEKRRTKLEERAERRRKKLEVDPEATESDTETESEAPADANTDTVPIDIDDDKTESSDFDNDDTEVSDDEAIPLSSQENVGAKPFLPGVEPVRPDVPLVLDEKNRLQVPKTINKYLRDYQQDGVRFFWEHYNTDHGAILGDDMGLGKTIQVISFLSAIMKKHGDERDKMRRYIETERLMADAANDHPNDWVKVLPKPNATWPTCLLVCPVPLLSNWENELHKWGYFEVGRLRSKGTDHRRQFQLGRLDILLASFDSIVRDYEQLIDLDWSLIIVDEAHKIKNIHGKTFDALSSFKCLHRYALTGTAIQNNYEELWALLDWCNPGKVGSIRQWKRSISTPLKEGQSLKSTAIQVKRAKVVASALSERLLPRFFLRRTKDLIAHQMPKKIDQVAFCPLTPTQIMVYRNFLATEDVQRLLRKDEPCPCGKEDMKRGKCCHIPNDGDVLRFVNLFAKISNSIHALYPEDSDGPEKRVRLQKDLRIAFPGRSNTEIYRPLECNPMEQSGKWKVLDGLLNQWESENDQIIREQESSTGQPPKLLNKVLIFTKSKKLYNAIQASLVYDSRSHSLLCGDMTTEERDFNIERFQTDPEVFVLLLTIQTGGVGLNLTAANKVIIFDPNWNPALDLQAMDRAFRIGQARDVEVYRLIAAGCLEELIYKRQVYKQQQMKIAYEASQQARHFDGVQGDKQKQGELFGIKNIFALGSTRVVDDGARYERSGIDDDFWRQHAADDQKDTLEFLTEPPEETVRKTMKKRLFSLGVVDAHSNDTMLKEDKPKVSKPRKTKREDDESMPPRFSAPSRKRIKVSRDSHIKKEKDVMMELSD